MLVYTLCIILHESGIWFILAVRLYMFEEIEQTQTVPKYTDASESQDYLKVRLTLIRKI